MEKKKKDLRKSRLYQPPVDSLKVLLNSTAEIMINDRKLQDLNLKDYMRKNEKINNLRLLDPSSIDILLNSGD